MAKSSTITRKVNVEGAAHQLRSAVAFAKFDAEPMRPFPGCERSFHEGSAGVSRYVANNWNFLSIEQQMNHRIRAVDGGDLDVDRHSRRDVQCATHAGAGIFRHGLEINYLVV